MDSDPSLRYFDNAIPDAPASEDAPAAVEEFFETAPDEDALPQDDGAAEENPSEDSTPDYKALYEQTAAEKAQLAQERRQYEQQLAQQQREQARQQWSAQAGQIVEQAKQYDYDQAVQYVAQQFMQREQTLLQAAEQSTMQTQTEGYAQHVMEQYGLDPKKDRNRLGNDPYQFEALAATVKEDRAEMAELRKQLKQIQRGNQAQARLATGVDRTGGGQGRPLPKNLRDLSPEEHLRVLFQQNGVL